MVGMRRLDHLQACVVDVLERKIPGDLIETGVWRGGASIFMAANAIIDDFALPGCRLAVEDYRREHQIVEPIRDIDGNGAFWQRDHA